MTDSRYTHCTLVVDRSGSMDSVREEAQGGINHFLTEQYAQPGRLTVTLTQFDTDFDTVARMAAQPVAYTLEPRGMTALLDAVGQEVLATGRDLAALPEAQRPGRVLLLIVTDGQENSSHEFTLAAVRDLLEQQKAVYGWQVQFVGAGDAAWQGEQLGVRSTQYSPTRAGTSAVYSVMSDAVSAFRAAPEPAAMFEMPDTVTGDEDPTSSGDS